jgi:hypothetical protein
MAASMTSVTIVWNSKMPIGEANSVNNQWLRPRIPAVSEAM